MKGSLIMRKLFSQISNFWRSSLSCTAGLEAGHGVRVWYWIFFLSFCCSTAQAAPQIELVTEVLPPFTYHDKSGKGEGFTFEIVEEICKITRDCKPPQFLPWSRAVKMATDNPDTAIFSMYRKPEREKQFHWVGPLAKANVVFMGLAGRGLKVTSMEDAKKLPKIGVQKDSTHHKILEAQGFTNLELTAASDETIGNPNIQKLVAGRFDAWIATEQSARAKGKLLGIDDNKLETLYVISEDELYLAFNLGTSKATVARWQKALDDVKTKPVYRALQKKYNAK